MPQHAAGIDEERQQYANLSLFPTIARFLAMPSTG
jgi:hypothetical protein